MSNRRSSESASQLTSAVSRAFVGPPIVRSTEVAGLPSSFDHPAGYKQNPYASELRLEQPLFTEAGRHDSYTGLPSPSAASNTYSGAHRPRGSIDEAMEAWNSAKKWMTNKGAQFAEQLGDIHKKGWDGG